MSDELLTPEQACKLLNIPKGTLSSMTCRRAIPHVRLGPRTPRYRKTELETWLKDRIVPQAN